MFMESYILRDREFFFKNLIKVLDCLHADA